MITIEVFYSFTVQIRSLDAVKYVEEDGVAHEDETWGLDRIDQRYLPLDDQYKPIGKPPCPDEHLIELLSD